MWQSPPHSLCNEEHKESFAEKSSPNDREQNTPWGPSTEAHLKCAIRRIQQPRSETFLRSPRVKHHKSYRIPPCSCTEALLKGCTVKKKKQEHNNEALLKRPHIKKTNQNLTNEALLKDGMAKQSSNAALERKHRQMNNEALLKGHKV